MVVEAAIAEVTSVRSQVESRIASLAENAEGTTSCIVGEMSQRLQHGIEAVASGTAAASAQNIQAVIEGLRVKLQVKFNQDRAELQQKHN